ncbi:MAG: 3-oxoacyl-ACP synthase, partial [Desulfatitalea sp.]|nr:3-oxoacyl-ACP synthase [Desulfatitalea sp.]
MTGVAAHIAAMGIVSAIGCGVEETLDSLYAARRGLSPIMLFAVPADQIRPAGIVTALKPDARMPRTHLLARLAADQIFAESGQIPDAIVLGTTTGGIATTETLMAEGVQDPEQYRRHALSSVGEDLARRCGCTGPVITISTACSSGAAAIVLALQLLRDGLARRVLAGGVDSLCRLTYFGFNALQLIDPLGARPLDRDRKGMSVAEGAAMLLLTTDSCTGARMEICGAGLSCDAYH